MPRQLGQWVRKSAASARLAGLHGCRRITCAFRKKKKKKKFSVYREAARGKEHNWTGGSGEGCRGVGSLKITGGRRLAGGMCQQHRTEHLEPAMGKRPRSDVRRSTAGAATRHVTTRHAERLGTESMHLALAWANYGPGAICSPLSFRIRPAEHEEIILIASK